MYEGMFHVSSKIAKTMQNVENIMVGESSLQEMANLGDYPGDFLETGRYGPNLETPGLSRRVDSTDIEVTSTARSQNKSLLSCG